MGYRSDVAISVSKNLEERFDKLFKDVDIIDTSETYSINENKMRKNE